MPHSLVILNGTRPGTTLRLDGDATEVTIGRHISNDLQLDDDKASRMHSRVSLRGDRWHIEDCDSLNGTHVNSQPIKQSLLEPGDLIRIADRLILFVDTSSEDGPSDVQTSVFRATTMMGRNHPPQVGGLVEQSVNDSMSRIVRD